MAPNARALGLTFFSRSGSLKVSRNLLTCSERRRSMLRASMARPRNSSTSSSGFMFSCVFLKMKCLNHRRKRFQPKVDPMTEESKSTFPSGVAPRKTDLRETDLLTCLWGLQIPAWKKREKVLEESKYDPIVLMEAAFNPLPTGGENWPQIRI